VIVTTAHRRGVALVAGNPPPYKRHDGEIVQQKTVLLVEDEAEVRESLEDALSDEGYTVVSASNGQQALQALPGLPRPCAVVLDIIMPIVSGNEVYAAMIADPRFADIPVVISTSDPSRAPSGVLIMKKPVDLPLLLATVASVFKASQAGGSAPGGGAGVEPAAERSNVETTPPKPDGRSPSSESRSAGCQAGGRDLAQVGQVG
jgi:two-component system, chemotaxis family, chemotaxis protein CheY